MGAQRPFGAAKHSERRCSEANRRRCPRMNPAAKEPEPKRGPNVRVKPFWLLFRRLEKVTRRKGGTLSSRYRRNGYVLSQKEPRRLTKSLREQARSHSGNWVHLQEPGRPEGRHVQSASGSTLFWLKYRFKTSSCEGVEASPATCHNRRSIPCATICPTAASIADNTHNCAGSFVV